MKLKSTGLKFKNLGNPPTTIQTPDNHISLPTQVLAVGSVGRGKTFWITNLLRQLKESKCMDRIFFISSTVSSNLKLLQDLDIKEYDIYDPEDPNCIANIYQKNMAPKKSKVKKPKVKKRFTQPARSIIERTICAHPMLKRVQKEVRELKKKSAKKYKK